jgi:regulator of replication initiation timing
MSGDIARSVLQKAVKYSITPEDTAELTKSIRETHYQLQLDYQALMLKATTLQAENEDLKERLAKIAEKIQLDI